MQRLRERGEDISYMAPRLKRRGGRRNPCARNSVSIAINHFKFPKVIRAIRDYLEL